MNVISTVSKQWASRPDDQRYLSVADLYASVKARRQASEVEDVSLENVTVRAIDGGDLALFHGHDGSGAPIGTLTHWSFGQLCQRAGASAGYLRSLPAEIAQIPLAYSLEHAGHEDRDAKILVRASRDNGRASIDAAAVTSPSYGRIWDEEVVRTVMDRVDLNVWKIPGASYAAKDPKRASTLYASDRDTFMFLVDETRPIEVSGERMFRGFYVWNSETGSETFGIATFLYRFVCDNRNIWGPAEFREIKIRHTSGGPHRFMMSVVPMLRRYAEASDAPYRAMIEAARTTEIGRDRKGVMEWLKARGFTNGVAAAAYANAENEGLNPRSVWGLVQGVTEHAHTLKHTDARVDLERKAGTMLDRVSV
jgi:hypothetical protein